MGMGPEHGIRLTSVAMVPGLGMGLHPLLQLLEIMTPILNTCTFDITQSCVLTIDIVHQNLH